MARLFYGWVVVAGAFVVLFVAYGAQYSFGVFFAALLDEFGWSRASLSGAFAIYAFAYSVLGFPAGRLTDSWGPGRVIAIGGGFLGVALAGMAAVTQLWQPYVLYGVVAAIGMGTAYVPCHATIVKWFVERRGLALGVASSGSSVRAIVLPPLAQALVAAAGWRTAYVIYGLAVFVTLSVVALAMRRDPESVGLHPDGGGRRHQAAAENSPAWSLGRAGRTPAFWLLAAAFSATWLPVFILCPPGEVQSGPGLLPLVGASVISTLGLGAVVGRLGMGAVSTGSVLARRCCAAWACNRRRAPASLPCRDWERSTRWPSCSATPMGRFRPCSRPSSAISSGAPGGHPRRRAVRGGRLHGRLGHVDRRRHLRRHRQLRPCVPAGGSPQRAGNRTAPALPATPPGLPGAGLSTRKCYQPR